MSTDYVKSKDKVYDIVGIGNALVDITLQGSERIVNSIGIEPRVMTLISEEQLDSFKNISTSSKELPGGVVANALLMSGFLGNDNAFIGKITTDMAGEAFTYSLNASKTHICTDFSEDGDETSKAFIIVKSDGKTTIATYLGSSHELEAKDIDENTISNSQIILLELYLLDTHNGYEVIDRTIELAKKYDKKVALILCNNECVKRHLDKTKDLVENHATFLFASRSEIRDLYQNTDYQNSVNTLVSFYGTPNKIAIITLSEEGALCIKDEETSNIPLANKLLSTDIVDYTGSSSVFVGAFLHSYLAGNLVEDSIKIGLQYVEKNLQHLGVIVTNEDFRNELKHIAKPTLKAKPYQNPNNKSGVGDGW